MKVSLSHMKPLKNDSNIDKERRESTTIYLTSIRQSNECVGGIEWTELMLLDEIAWKETFLAFLSVRSRSWSFPQSSSRALVLSFAEFGCKA